MVCNITCILINRHFCIKQVTLDEYICTKGEELQYCRTLKMTRHIVKSH